MAPVDDLLTLTKKVETATSAITDEIGRLRARIMEARRALNRAQDLLLPLEEIEDRIRQHIQLIGDLWLRDHPSLVLQLGHPRERRDPLGPTATLEWGAVCAGSPDLAFEIQRGLVGRMPYTAGAPAAERPALIAKLEQELAALEATDEALVDRARLAGVTIEHRPEVVERRETERRQRELEDARGAALRDRQAAVDARYGSSEPRVGHSEYLADHRGDPRRG